MSDSSTSGEVAVSVQGPPYPDDTLGEHQDDDGTMPDNVEALRELVVGHRIVKAESAGVKSAEFEAADDSTYGRAFSGLVITLDSGVRVLLEDSSDCCAFTSLSEFLLHPERVDHIITGVATEGGYTKWHIFADFGDVMELEVDWSAGNPFYYGYGFNIYVSNVLDAEVVQRELPAGGA